jgi:hypothetical protein
MGARRLLIALICAVAVACGDDEGDNAPDSGPPGEPCAAPGIGDNRCSCTPQQPLGYRECRANRTWSPCECAPAGTQDTCTSGQPVRCTPCPPSTEYRIIQCSADDTFDCSCPDNEADGG